MKKADALTLLDRLDRLLGKPERVVDTNDAPAHEDKTASASVDGPVASPVPAAPAASAAGLPSGLLGDLIGEGCGDEDALRALSAVATAIAVAPTVPIHAAQVDQAAPGEPVAAVIPDAPDDTGGATEARPAAAQTPVSHEKPQRPRRPAARRAVKMRPSWIKPAPHHAREAVPMQVVVLRKGAQSKRRELGDFIANLPLDRNVEVRIRAWSPSHTDDQRGYLWGVVYKTIADFTGYDVNDLHDIYLGLHFGRETREILGVPVSRPSRRSSGLGTQAYFDYTEFIRQHAMEKLGCFVPLPEKDLEARMRLRLQAEIDAETRALARARKDAGSKPDAEPEAGPEAGMPAMEARQDTEAREVQNQEIQQATDPEVRDGPWNIALF